MRRRSVIGEAGWFQAGTPEQRRRFVDAVQAGRQTAAWNRELIGRFPDLVAELMRKLGYERYDQWNGYIPPRFYEAGNDLDGERWLPNDSPARTVLLDLIAQAEAREAS
jgi:hypothetical protein